MTRLGDAIARHTRKRIFAQRQIRQATFRRPYGLRRGVVEVGNCTLEVNADRPSDLAPGESVLVARDGGRLGGQGSGAGKLTILTSTPAKAGPTIVETAQLGGTPLPAAAWYVYQDDGVTGFVVSRYKADGSWFDDFGAPTVFPGQYFAGGPYAASGSFSEGWFTSWASVGGAYAPSSHDVASLTTYAHTNPAGKISGPAFLVGSRLYFIEADVNEEPAGCLGSLPVRLKSAALDFTDVQEEASGSIAGLDPGNDCYWYRASLRSAIRQAFVAGSKIGVETSVWETPIKLLYEKWYAFSAVDTSPALIDATVNDTSDVDSPVHAQDLNGTHSLAPGSSSANVMIRNTASIDNAWTEWLSAAAVGFAAAVHVPPAQDAVFILAGASPSALDLKEYTAVTSSPVLQSTVSLEAHPTLVTDQVQVWRIGG